MSPSATSDASGYRSLQDLLEWVRGGEDDSLVAIVTMKEARLWTDSRYFLQASKQLPPFWTLMKMGSSGCPTISVLSIAHYELGMDDLLSPREESCGSGRDASLRHDGRGVREETGSEVHRIRLREGEPHRPNLAGPSRHSSHARHVSVGGGCRRDSRKQGETRTLVYSLASRCERRSPRKARTR